MKSNPTLGDDLESGDITEDHMDALAGAGKDLDDDKKEGLFNDPEIEDAARRMPPEPFRKFAKTKADKLGEDEGEDRLAKQKAATRLRARVRKDGMHVVNGEFDPETGSRVLKALEDELDTLAARDRQPRNDHTRAAALASLLDRGAGAGPNPAPPEILVIDAATLTNGLHDHSVHEMPPPPRPRRPLVNPPPTRPLVDHQRTRRPTPQDRPTPKPGPRSRARRPGRPFATHQTAATTQTRRQLNTPEPPQNGALRRALARGSSRPVASPAWIRPIPPKPRPTGPP